MKFKKIFSLACLIGCCYSICIGQIKYKIELLNGIDLYQVSLVSDQNYSYPDNIVGTAQVSIKAPVSGFELGTLTSLNETASWTNNALIISPEEAKDFQYLSFALTSRGTILPLQAMTEVPLFTFKNNIGACPGTISLVNNESDVFLPPNSKNANIGNQITILASSRSRNQNAYSGNILKGSAECLLSTNLEDYAKIEDIISIELYPNPTVDWIEVTIQSNNLTKDDMYLQLRKIDGSIIQERRLTHPLSAKESIRLDVNSLSGGEYIINLVQKNKILSKKFIKIQT